MVRMMADCRGWPSETNCSLVIIGEEHEVVKAAAEHAARSTATRTPRSCAPSCAISSSARIGIRLSLRHRKRSRADHQKTGAPKRARPSHRLSYEHSP
jgi:hypothetical protein